MKRLDWFHWLLLGLLVIGGVVLWLTPYQYEHFDRIPIRIHRITGKADRLTSRGWVPMRSLEEEYPKYERKIKEARREGYTDLEIRRTLEELVE